MRGQHVAIRFQRKVVGRCKGAGSCRNEGAFQIGRRRYCESGGFWLKGEEQEERKRSFEKLGE